MDGAEQGQRTTEAGPRPLLPRQSRALASAAGAGELRGGELAGAAWVSKQPSYPLPSSCSVAGARSCGGAAHPLVPPVAPFGAALAMVTALPSSAPSPSPWAKRGTRGSNRRHGTRATCVRSGCFFVPPAEAEPESSSSSADVLTEPSAADFYAISYWTAGSGMHPVTSAGSLNVCI
ncbi:unnamed protein product [Urochloa humidicola]